MSKRVLSIFRKDDNRGLVEEFGLFKRTPKTPKIDGHEYTVMMPFIPSAVECDLRNHLLKSNGEYFMLEDLLDRRDRILDDYMNVIERFYEHKYSSSVIIKKLCNIEDALNIERDHLEQKSEYYPTETDIIATREEFDDYNILCERLMFITNGVSSNIMVYFG